MVILDIWEMSQEAWGSSPRFSSTWSSRKEERIINSYWEIETGMSEDTWEYTAALLLFLPSGPSSVWESIISLDTWTGILLTKQRRGSFEGGQEVQL